MIKLAKNDSVGIQDVTLVALYKFFKDEAKVSDVQALEAAEAVIRLQGEGRLDEVLAIAKK